MNTNAVSSGAKNAVHAKKQQLRDGGAAEGFINMLNAAADTESGARHVQGAGRGTEGISSKRENQKSKIPDSNITGENSNPEAYAAIDTAQHAAENVEGGETPAAQRHTIHARFTIYAAEDEMPLGTGMGKGSIRHGNRIAAPEREAGSLFSDVTAGGGEASRAGRGHSWAQARRLSAQAPESEAVSAMANPRSRNTGPETSIGFSRLARNLKGAEFEARTREISHTEAPRWAARPEISFPRNVESAMDNAIGRAARELGIAGSTEAEVQAQDIEEASVPETLQAGGREGSDEVVKSLGREERKSGEAAMIERSERPAERAQSRVRQESRSGIRENEPMKEQNTAGTAQVAEPREIAREAPVSQPQRSQLSQAPQAEQIRAEVVRNLENREMQFTMTLNPEELGRIDVKMALQGGKLMIEIISSARVSELLSRQTDSLAAALRQNAAGDITSVEVVAEPRSFMGTMDGAFNMNGGSYDREENASHGGGGGAENAYGEFQDNLEEAGAQIGYESQSLLNYAI